MNSAKPQIFCLMGPTASGKTALACELVTRFPFEIISVDSAMIYRDMNIGTAKPSQHELSLAPHYLIDIKDPIESYSASQFCTDALSLCHSIVQQGKIPLLVGGTMMYFNALQRGLSALPDADMNTRQQLEQEAEQKGWQALYQKLSRVDPKTAARIHAHDKQRIQRALEVYYLSGVPLSALLEQQKDVLPFECINLALMPEQRSWLHERIAARFNEMLASGLIEEVQALQNKWKVQPHLPSMRSVGYRQVLDYLSGHRDKSLLRDQGIAATRQLAKRQLTWLRHWEKLLVYDPQDGSVVAKIMAQVQEILDNNPF